MLLGERLGRAPSVRPGARPRSRAASRRGRAPSFHDPPPPSAAAASAVARRGRSRARRARVAGRRSARTAATRARPRLPLRPPADRSPGRRRPAARAARPTPPGRGRAPRRRGAPARPPPGARRPGNATRRSNRSRPAIRSSRRSRPGMGSTAWRAIGVACQTHSRMRCGRSFSLAGMHRDDPGRMEARGTARLRVQELVLGDVEAALLELSAKQQPRSPGCSRSASQARLNQTALTLPLESKTSASRIVSRRRRVGRSFAPATSTSTVASSPSRRAPSPTGFGPVPVAVRDVPEQVAEARRSPSRPRRPHSFGPAPFSFVIGASRIEGRGSRLQRRLQQVRRARGPRRSRPHVGRRRRSARARARELLPWRGRG